MTYGYARVSTHSQAVSGSSLDDQIFSLRAAGVPINNIFQESYTGTTVERPQFLALINQLKEGDKLVVTKLDRFARTAVEGGSIVKDLHDRGVIIHILNMGIVDNTPMGKLMITMLLAFAEFERDMIVERTQSGRERTGRLGGRPRKFNQAQRNLAMELLAQGHSYSQVEQQTGISKSTLIREHNLRTKSSHNI